MELSNLQKAQRLSDAILLRQVEYEFENERLEKEMERLQIAIDRINKLIDGRADDSERHQAITYKALPIRFAYQDLRIAYTYKRVAVWVEHSEYLAKVKIELEELGFNDSDDEWPEFLSTLEQ